MEGKNGHVRKAARLAAVNFGAYGLGRVFHANQALLPAQVHDVGHIGHIAVKIHGHDGPCFGRDGFLDGLGRDNAGKGVNIGPDQPCAMLDEGIGAGRKSVAGDDNFVARLEIAELGAHFQGRAAIHHSKAAALFDALI